MNVIEKSSGSVGFNTLVYVIHYCKSTYTGVVIIAERFANDKLKDNLNPVGRLFMHLQLWSAYQPDQVKMDLR